MKRGWWRRIVSFLPLGRSWGPCHTASACALGPRGSDPGCQLGAIRLPGRAHLAHLDVDSGKGGVEGRLAVRKLAHQLQQGGGGAGRRGGSTVSDSSKEWALPRCRPGLARLGAASSGSGSGGWSLTAWVAGSLPSTLSVRNGAALLSTSW